MDLEPTATSGTGNDRGILNKEALPGIGRMNERSPWVTVKIVTEPSRDGLACQTQETLVSMRPFLLESGFGGAGHEVLPALYQWNAIRRRLSRKRLQASPGDRPLKIYTATPMPAGLSLMSRRRGFSRLQRPLKVLLCVGGWQN
jgi:hypothetical protein